MQIAQLYLGMWMAGGILAVGSLLVGNFGRRGAQQAFSPSMWVSAAAASLTLAGLTGICSLGMDPQLDPQLASLGPSLGAGAVAGLLAIVLQRHAAAAAAQSHAMGS